MRSRGTTHRLGRQPRRLRALRAVLFALLVVGLLGPQAAVAQDAGAAPPVAAPPAAPPVETAPAPEASPVTATVELDALQLKLGDTLTYKVRFETPPGYQVYMPDRPALDAFYLVPNSRKETRQESPEGLTVDATMALRAYRLGVRKIPAIEVPYLGPNGETGTVTLPQQKIRVLSRLANEAEPTLAAPGEPVAVITTNWLLIWLLIALGGGLVATLVTVLVLRHLRRREARMAPPPPPRPAHEIALEKLAAVEREQLLDQGRLMEFYVRVSEAVREYFGNRFGFDGLTLTSFELLGELRNVELKGVPTARVQMFLDEADLVKFASFQPTREESETLLRMALNLVHDTMERPVLAAEPSAPNEEEE